MSVFKYRFVFLIAYIGAPDGSTYEYKSSNASLFPDM